MDIKSFGNIETEQFARNGKFKKGCSWAFLSRIAHRKIDMILFAHNISDLKVPPNNHLEKLDDDLNGFWSIRINRQFRIIFKVVNNAIEELKITDYHKG